jgi:hypothetical protein
MWHIDPLLDNDRETTRQRPLLGSGPRNNGSNVEVDVFYVAHSEAVSRDRPSSDQLVQLRWEKWSYLVGEWVRGLLRFSPCELLLLEAGSWGTRIVREPRVRGTSAVRSRYQATTGEDTADWKDLVRDVVNCRECELMIAIYVVACSYILLVERL